MRSWALAGAILAATGTTPAAAQDYQFSRYQVSYAPGVIPDGKGGTIGGTEIRDLVAFDGKLWASLSYWMDQRQAGNGQILRLDSPDGPWRLDLDMGSFCTVQQGPRCTQATGVIAPLQFTRDQNGTPVNVWILAATDWPWVTPPAPINLYARNNADGKWYRTQFATAPNGAQARALTTYVDKKTGESLAFASISPYGIGTGKLAANRAAGQNPIVWNTGTDNLEWTGAGAVTKCSSEGAGDTTRVMGFAEAGGQLFATRCFDVIKRIDGPRGNCRATEVSADGACSARWVPFYTVNATSESGFRGITAVENNNALIMGWEGTSGRVTRLDPMTGAAQTELDISDTISSIWGFPTNYLIASYTAPMALWWGGDGRGRRIIGLHAFVDATADPPLGHQFVLQTYGSATGPPRRLEGDGWYFLRDAAFSYRLFQIPNLIGKPINAIRAAAPSPFAGECNSRGQECAIYFGGSDMDNSPSQTPCFAGPCNLATQPTTAMAWVIKGVP